MSEFAELDEIERSDTPDSFIFEDGGENDEDEQLVEEEFEGVSPLTDEPAAIIPEEYEPAAPHQTKFVGKRQISPSDEALIKDILEKYPGAVDPKTIRELSKSELHQHAHDIGVGGFGVQEIVDINVPIHRVKPVPPQLRKVTAYDPAELYRFFAGNSDLSPQSARIIFDIIWSAKKPESKKIQELATVIYHSNLKPDDPDMDYIIRQTKLKPSDIKNRYKTIQNLFDETPQDYNNIKNLFLNVAPPPMLVDDLKALKTTYHKKYPDIARPIRFMKMGTTTIDPAKTREFGTRELLDALIKLALLQMPLKQAHSLTNEIFGAKSCNVWDLKGCSKHAKEIIPAYKKMAEYISQRLAKKYPDLQQYLAGLSIILLHLDRSNPVGFFSTGFQYNLFANPELAISANYETDILPDIFTSKQVKKLVAEERQDAYKDLIERMYFNQFKKPPQYGEQRHMSRLDRHADFDRLYGAKRPEYDIYHEPEHKKFSITVGDTTHMITATTKLVTEDDTLFEDLYMIRYMPSLNHYMVIRFNEEDGAYIPRIIGTTKDLGPELDVKLGQPYSLDAVNTLFIPRGFYRITDDEFFESPEETAKLFSRASKSTAPIPLVKTAPLKLKKATPKVPVSQSYNGLKNVLNKMGGQV